MGGSTDPLQVGDFTANAFASDEFTTAAPTYDYPYHPFSDPRNEIRLLRYTGASHEKASAMLCFEVITVQCPSGPDHVAQPFYAVSYSWGTIAGVAQILLDGHEVDVPYSSEAALRGLITDFKRGAGDPYMPIWIDAICINQRDIAEQTEQLSLMGRLYKSAHTVCVWLGPAGQHTTGALQALNALKNGKEAWLRENGEDATPPNGNLVTPSGCNWEELSTLIAVPWFNRVWTIQEIVLARPGQAIVFCGRYSFSWDDFALAIQWAWYSHRDLWSEADRSNIYQPVLVMIRVRNRYKLEGGVQLSRLLVNSTNRGATKHEDRIYGLLGMRPQEEADRGDIVQSYGEPLGDRYTTAVATIMETERSLLLLEQMAIKNRIGHSTGPQQEQNWPTWVPRLDLQAMNWDDPDLTSAVTGVQPSNANNHLPAPMIRSTPTEGLLHLKGLRVGTVELAFESLVNNQIITTRAAKTNNWIPSEVARHYSYLWAPEFIDDSSSRETIVAVADSLSIGGYLELKDNHRTLIRDFGAMMHHGWELHSDTERNRLVRPDFTQEPNLGSIRDFVENVAGRASRFRHFKMSSNRFGTGPETTMNDDIVVILLGVNTPMIMRPKGQHYSLLGAAYVSEIMQGEYMRSLSAEDISDRAETFDIC